jgi:endonuclease G
LATFAAEIQSTLAVVAFVLAACAPQSAIPRPPEPSAATNRSPERTTSRLRIESSPHLALGLPVDADQSDAYLMDKGVFVLSYNRAHHAPNWVAWRLTKDDLGDEERTNEFRADEDLPTGFLRIKPTDYARSGYDRGHMCPSAHRTAARDANSLTFLMTNMQPQVHALNAGPWKSLETYERERVAEGKVMFVVAGGIFPARPERIGPGIAVPEANFRVTVELEPGQGPSEVSPETRILGVIMPNNSSAKGRDWEGFRARIDEIEHAAGYDVLSHVKDEIEALLEAR